MKILRHLLRESRTTLVVAVASSLLNGASTAGLLALLNELLVLHAGQPSTLKWLYPVLLVAIFVSGVVAQIVLIRLAANVAARLRLLLARQILQLPLPRLEELGVNRLYATLTQDVTSVSNAWIALPILSFHVAILMGGVGYLAWLSIPLLGFVLFWFALGIGIYQWIARRGQALLGTYRTQQDSLFEEFETLLRGTKELQLDQARQESFLTRSLAPTVERLRDLQYEAFRAWAIGTNWASVLTFIVIGVLLAVGAVWLGTPAPVATSFVIAILFLRAHVGGALGAAPPLAQGNVALAKIAALGLSDDEPESRPEISVPRAWTALEFRGVEYEYAGEGHFQLGPLNLVLQPGELIFVTGGNGSGKSTFAKLLTGLYAPSRGEVLLDGKALDDEDRDSYRAYFSAVFTDFFVFDELASHGDAATDAKAREHIERFDLAGKVDVEEGRLTTTKLSLGERKRLALIAAYLQDRPIIVLDEWAADQDVRFKDIFYREILEDLTKRGKTVIVISHDDRYFGQADRLVRLEDGRLSVSSTPVLDGGDED